MFCFNIISAGFLRFGVFLCFGLACFRWWVWSRWRVKEIIISDRVFPRIFLLTGVALVLILVTVMVSRISSMLACLVGTQHTLL